MELKGTGFCGTGTAKLFFLRQGTGREWDFRDSGPYSVVIILQISINYAPIYPQISLHTVCSIFVHN